MWTGKYRFLKPVLCALVLVTGSPAFSDEAPAFSLQETLGQVRAQYNLIGIGAAIASGQDGLLEAAVSGHPTSRSDDLIPLEDGWHIGSNTKMLTAAGYAVMVKNGDARWGATLPELFPDLAASMHAGWQDVSIEELLAHRAGLAANPSVLRMISSAFNQTPLDQQRIELVESILSQPPSGTRGEYAYSNLGFIIVGTAMEAIAQKNAPAKQGEKAIIFERLLPDLLRTSAPDALELDFGPPKGKIQGHKAQFFMGGALSPGGKGGKADNPAAFGPAGTANLPVGAHAAVLSDLFLSGDETFTAMMRSWPDDNSTYGFGFGLIRNDPNGGTCFSHNGSNTMWLSFVAICPEIDLAVVVNTNAYSDNAGKALNDIAAAAIKAYAARAAE